MRSEHYNAYSIPNPIFSGVTYGFPTPLKRLRRLAHVSAEGGDEGAGVGVAGRGAGVRHRGAAPEQRNRVDQLQQLAPFDEAQTCVLAKAPLQG